MLGKGGQGTVFLARDTHLGRDAAVKTLRLGHADAAERGERMRALLEEARIVSRLQHPNIVTLYDAGEDRGVPYLVFEYVEGRTLASMIRETGKLPCTQAVDIAQQLLQGIGFAHAKGVVHRDLKPGNVILTTGGVPRVMDFGIARHALDPRGRAGGQRGEESMFGTPVYMAPEYITSREFTPVSDLFALGMVLYEMLTGQPAAKAQNMFETLHHIVNVPFALPGEFNPEVDERLTGVVMKALAKDPKERFQTAGEMGEALAAWLEPAPGVSVDGTQGTLEFLIRRIRHKSDFPALSTTVGNINRVLASDRERTSVLCNSILKDFALTSKLLKLVNAAYFNQFGGSISTVSRAVGILGFDGIRSVAMSLVLFDHLQNKTQATALRDEVSSTYFSGVLAREFVHKLGIRDAEEAFICAMFHRLGKLLVTFYLHDEAQAIERLMQSQQIGEARAAVQVLGVAYEDLGMGVAKKWNFPDKIVNSMRPLTEAVNGRPAFETDKLRAVSDLANSLSDIVRFAEPAGRSRAFGALMAKYGKGIGIDEKTLTSVVEESAKALSRDAEFLGLNAAKSPFFAATRTWIAQPEAESKPEPATLVVEQTQLKTADPAALFDAAGEVAKGNRQAVLAAGVQDITNTLVSDYELNDVLRIILETMYRAIGFSRVLLCVSEPRQGVLRARFGFGADAEAVVRSGFAISLAGRRDVFYAALTQGADICIEDIDAEAIRAYVPEWYRALIKTRGMVLFPVMLKKRPVALIYADTDHPELLRFRPEELNMLKTLRNQAVLAFKQKC